MPFIKPAGDIKARQKSEPGAVHFRERLVEGERRRQERIRRKKKAKLKERHE